MYEKKDTAKSIRINGTRKKFYMTTHEKTIEWIASKRKKTVENHLERRSIGNKN
jgi:hypothetical protein